MSETIITAPLFVILPRKTKADRKMYINLNGYRNWHYLVSNQVKKIYKETVKPQLEELKYDGVISLTLQLFKGTKRRTDKANFLSIHEKFFCDALVECGCIEDDNDDHILKQRYLPTELDRENPRVEIIIREEGLPSTEDANE